jgi:hypothetical protein
MPTCCALAALLLAAPVATPEEEADVTLLHGARVPADAAGLLTFFRSRTLTDEGRAVMEAAVARLGSDRFAERERASAALVAKGPLAIPFLRAARNSPDPEVARRARRCLEAVETGPAAPAAAVRTLARHNPPGATAVLLGYAPYADDDTVTEEVLAALTALGLHDGKAVPDVTAALADRLPARRAAAAYVAGRSRDAAQRDAAAKLLADVDAAVRFRAAQGLAAGGERRAVSALIDLLADGTPDVTWRAEELLLRLAGEQGPAGGPGAGTPAERRRWRDDWAAWWRGHGDKVDVARASAAPAYLGLTLVPEMHANRVWECGRDGRVRWEIKENLRQPIDAQVLPGGHVLVAEAAPGRVSERDRKGNVLWEAPAPKVGHVRRLPNGNTFVGSLDRAFEINPAGKEVAAWTPGPNFTVNGVDRRPDGNVVFISVNGKVVEFDAAGKPVFTLDLPAGNWCGVKALPNNRYLVAVINPGKVQEVDRAGKVWWQCEVAGATYAERLPGGNTLVCAFGGQRVVEVDRKGKVVWEKGVGSAPWRAHAR